MDEKRYLNFPIRMLEELLLCNTDQKKSRLNDIVDIALFQHSKKLEGQNEYEETELERMSRTINYYFLFVDSPHGVLRNGKELFESYESAKVYVGVSTSIIIDFLNNDKDPFEWECLVAYLALKSIVGRKKYVKTNNTLMLARMSGCENILEYKETNGLRFSRYHLDKIKTELQLNWFTVYYSRFTKGFYVGFDITLEELVFEAESRKKTLKIKALENEKKEALQKALAKL